MDPPISGDMIPLCWRLQVGSVNISTRVQMTIKMMPSMVMVIISRIVKIRIKSNLGLSNTLQVVKLWIGYIVLIT